MTGHNSAGENITVILGKNKPQTLLSLCQKMKMIDQ